MLIAIAITIFIIAVATPTDRSPRLAAHVPAAVNCAPSSGRPASFSRDVGDDGARLEPEAHLMAAVWRRMLFYQHATRPSRN